MRFARIKPNAWGQMQLGAGIVVDSFNPVTRAAGNILGATTGGFSINSNPQYKDWAEDVDNGKPNTWQFKRIVSYDPTISGTFVSIDAATAKQLSGAGLLSGSKITPTHKLERSDFADVWVLGDYSQYNEGAGTAGFCAVHLMNAINTAGFQWTSTKDEKGKYPFEFHAHYDADNIDVVPMEIYLAEGIGEEVPSIRLSEKTINLSKTATATNHTGTLVAYTVPADATVTWTSGDSEVATVSGGVVTAVDTGTAIITASITDTNDVDYTDTCTVIVSA